MSYQVRVRVVRGKPVERVISKTRSKAKAHENASALRDALEEAFKGEVEARSHLQVRVVRIRPKKRSALAEARAVREVERGFKRLEELEESRARVRRFVQSMGQKRGKK